MKLLQRSSVSAVGDFVDVLKQVRTDEIAGEAEQSFQVVVVGPRGAGKTTLINRLAAGTFGGLLEPFGIRRLTELDTPLSPRAFEVAEQADLVLWVQDVTAPYVDEHFGQLRAARAFLNVANKADLLLGPPTPAANRAILISANSSDSVRQQLVPAILDALPHLHLALGRSFSIFRLEIA